MIEGADDFDFTCLLHTYFRVPEVSKTAITNLNGLTYVDKVNWFCSLIQKDIDDLIALLVSSCVLLTLLLQISCLQHVRMHACLYSPIMGSNNTENL